MNIAKFIKLLSGEYTLTLSPANLTGDRVITYPDADGEIMLKGEGNGGGETEEPAPRFSEIREVSGASVFLTEEDIGKMILGKGIDLTLTISSALDDQPIGVEFYVMQEIGANTTIKADGNLKLSGDGKEDPSGGFKLLMPYSAATFKKIREDEWVGFGAFQW